SRPALIRWTRSTRSAPSTGKMRFLPRRRAPSKRRPSSSPSGGANVFSVAMWARPAFSIGERDTSGSSSRTQASTSGSSGTQGRYRFLEPFLGLYILVDGLRHVSKMALRREDDPEDGRAAADGAHDHGLAQSDRRAQHTPEQSAEGDGSPDDEAHHRVHA